MIIVKYCVLEFTCVLAVVCAAGLNLLYTECVMVLYKNSVPYPFLYK